MPGALLRLKDAGYKLIVISNQAGIGRGYFTEAQYRLVEAEVARAILPAIFDGVYFCPDRPGSCDGPPQTRTRDGLRSATRSQLDLRRSFFIGDKAIDIACGRNAGVRTILVKTGYGASETSAAPDWIAEDFAAAADIILELSRVRA